MGTLAFSFLALLLSVAAVTVRGQTDSGDVAAMQDIKGSLILPPSLDWSSPDPCSPWTHVHCAGGRVDAIQLGGINVSGTLSPSIRNLTALRRFEVMNCGLSGPLPSFSGLSNLQVALLHHNGFTSIPSDFFRGLTGLQTIDLSYNIFVAWSIPDSLRTATSLQNFTAVAANIGGSIPDIFDSSTFPGLVELHLSFNNFIGGLPSSFAGSSIQSLWLNGKAGNSLLTGTIDVLAGMTGLVEVWLHYNQFTGPIPDLSGLKNLQDLSLRDNQLTGVVQASLLALPSLRTVNLTNNLLQGPTPAFASAVQVDMSGINSFCLPTPGVACAPEVSTLLSIAQAMGYPLKFAQNWKGNNPCDSGNPWSGITCSAGNITVINFENMGLLGTISANYSSITSLQKLILASNNLTGPIPAGLASLPNLKTLDVSNNNLSGLLPNFGKSVVLNVNGNPLIGTIVPTPGSPGTPGASPGGGGTSGGSSNKSSAAVIFGSLAGGIAVVGLVGLLVFCLIRKRPKSSNKVQSPNTVLVLHPQHSGDQEGVKITVGGSSANGGTSENFSQGSGTTGDVHVVEAGNMVISIQVLRNVTNNFSEQNVLGKGGFGTVYKGELHDGTKIAVKRMESGVMSNKGLNEFMAEIAVLTKVRHRHLVALLGYCLDGNERLLVYEYMPQGTLSSHLFSWKELGLKPLEWTRRLSIALDVGRGVEYLHSLAHQTFIHRDLKPSNILLGDDLRAKVADFGLVRLAPEGKGSFETRLAGTFGYLAPEYAVTGRVTTKVDVFSFGVILMELITGRRALDESQPEDSVHLVTWFRRMHLNKDTFKKAIDPVIDLSEETYASISTIAELAGHCCAREPYQRPDMGHAVSVLSSLVELWKPSEPDSEDIYGIDLDMTLPQALKKWQAYEGNSSSNIDMSTSSSYLASGDNTQTSIPTRPSGFASSFTSSDGR
ncbi:hypothetical protein MLD38_003852 [Melastoma candidum]|uniref:Uncharacterized protein n=2 Tax=Melastoma candidum TaxID=119954 RepID=A0ACB9S8H2_9MYRT|nr:hypothetical protein MLD38_003852 [Melastoma candidum]